MSSSDAVTVAFRASANGTIGGGHIVRCLSLATEFSARGARCSFFVNAEALVTVPQLEKSGFEAIVVPADTMSCRDIMRRHGDAPYRWLVFDDYRLNAEDERPMREVASHLFVVDDLADRHHDCDLLLDSVPRRVAADYAGLVPKHAVLLLGQQFAPMRSEFAALRAVALEKRRAENPARRVLVSFGLMDPGGISATAAASLAPRFPDIVFDVVLSSSAPSMGAVEALSRRYSNLNLLVSPRSMSQLMLEADIALGAGGSTGSERACLGLPSITFVLADNQRDLGRDFAERGAAFVFENVPGVWQQAGDAIARLLGDTRLRQEMGENAAKICDGLGAGRVWQNMLAVQSGQANRPDSVHIS